MANIKNNKNVKMKDIKESGLYSDKLLENLKNRHFEVFDDKSIVSTTNRNDIYFMEPLLYMIKNEFNTYEVYKYYSEKLQNDLELASEIIVDEPNLIEGTPISTNKQFILDNVERNPEIVRFMSSDLKMDSSFINQISEKGSPLVMQECIKNSSIEKIITENSSLSNNAAFMSIAIAEDVTLLKFASDELKNNKDFLKETSARNEEIVEYVADNVQEFGLEGIKGVQESSREFTVDDCLALITEMTGKNDDERYQKVLDKVKERGTEDPCVVRWITAMAAQRDDLTPDTIKRTLNYSLLTMEKTRQNLDESGSMNYEISNMQQLITPQILNKLISNLKEQGIEVDDKTQEKFDKYKEFYDKYHEQFAIKKREIYEESLKQKETEVEGR